MGAKPKVMKVGGLFPTKSLSLREDNADVAPMCFDWVTRDPTHGKIFVFDDWLEKNNYGYYNPDSFVAILTEPPSLHPENYEYIKANHDKFHSVLTYDRELLNAIPNGKFYPLGGSSIAFDDWGIYPKTKDVCMIVSEKNSMPGHKLRHEIVKEFDGKIDFYGAGVGKPFERKLDVLKDYKYCVVVESEYRHSYFSEKLIDAMSVGCYPIVYGYADHLINSLFLNIGFTKIGSLKFFTDRYRFPIRISGFDLMHNFEFAKKYAIAEDWIWTHYQELFT